MFKRQRAASPSSAQKRSRTGGAAPQVIKLGTELPPEDEGDDGAFVPVWKQTVTDERGRRRLHGAFTGGFSAGYFNTVGSKEGWTPKAFVSSRSNRNKDQAKAGTQRPEDFMDDEDLAEAAEMRQLETAQSFAAIGTGAADAPNDDFFGLFKTEEDTIGVKIIQKMGWRRDQGIGRKVRRAAHLDDNGLNSSIKDRHLFAPTDTQSMSTFRQDQRKGLGFQSESRLSRSEDDTEEKSSFVLPFLDRTDKPRPTKKSAPKQTSFGVGILNDTGSDDEDPYELGPKIKFNKTIGKEKKAKKPSKFAKAGAGVSHVVIPKKDSMRTTASLSKLSLDGKAPLRGFAFATEVMFQPNRPKFPPPSIPPGWTSAKGVTPESQRGFQTVGDAAKSSALDAKSRAALLGESQLPGKSIFNFISKESRDRIATVTGKVNLPQGLGESGPEGHSQDTHKTLWSFVPVLDKEIAAAALAKGATGWMPYAEDSAKRTRYVEFLELRAGSRQALPERASGMSVADWAKELEEFAHAARVFKPTTGFMASRFTSSTTSQSAPGSDRDDDTLLRAAKVKPTDPAEEAAKMGMYGPMTRSQITFHSTRLLCKRFNVAPPPDVPFAPETGKGTEKSTTEDAVNQTAMDEMKKAVLTRGLPDRPAWMNQTNVAVPVPETAHAMVDVEKNDALDKGRAPDEVFRSIFGDDDDSD
ncbi:G patch domain-containing protein 1 [Lophiostoma macrostomum CBS 122681]|uniref:G patch domain-containing protein 1 n=1 Tax=Lophiostoma macrostomum CBS 122681 TaxID=1314788 RepID=A0A6A6T1K9_9PLEO|nr:G patch domain-containing protein 1 [Lophiostoma macrostomum CBS 122681]